MTAMDELIRKVGIIPVPKTSRDQAEGINKAIRDAAKRSKRKKDIRRRTARSDGHRRRMEQVPESQLRSRTINPTKEGTIYSGRNFFQNKTMRDITGAARKFRFANRKIPI